jgi:hypothetical protein
VGCVQCIRTGANWFVKSKLSGARQVVAVALKTYSRPIPSPVHELRPARDTCEQCHWPSKFHGDRLVVKQKYADDEANTRSVSVLMLRIGGISPGGRLGIHGRHLDDNERIRYTSTNRRQTISEVSYVGDDGQTVRYVSEDAPPATAAPSEAPEQRAMDCITATTARHSFRCRSARWTRRSHRAGSARSSLREEEVGGAAARRNTRTATARPAPSKPACPPSIAKYPAVLAQQAAQVEAAARAVRDIYLRNVFPT